MSTATADYPIVGVDHTRFGAANQFTYKVGYELDGLSILMTLPSCLDDQFQGVSGCRRLVIGGWWRRCGRCAEAEQQYEARRGVVRQLRAAGVSYGVIAGRLGMTRGGVQAILR